jgi:hypothetical protein
MSLQGRVERVTWGDLRGMRTRNRGLGTAIVLEARADREVTIDLRLVSVCDRQDLRQALEVYAVNSGGASGT